MTSRNRRGKRPANMKARLGIAAAVLVGGGAIGVAVAASGHGAANNAASAGYTLNFHHTISEGSALNSALSEWQWSQAKSLTTLSEMAPVKTFGEAWHGKTEFAAQRGIVELATKHFLLVKSANGSLHVWWLDGTKFADEANSTLGMTALTGSNSAAKTAMTTGNMTPATVTLAGSTTAANAMAAPVAKPVTVTVDTGSATITVTITQSSATVSTPATTPATTAGTSATTASSTTTATGPMVTATQPVFAAPKGVARGDLALVTGVKEHGFLIAKLVLFTPPATTVTPTTSPTATPTISVAPTTSVTAVPSAQGGVISGTHS
jgi:hypothetical protein